MPPHEASQAVVTDSDWQRIRLMQEELDSYYEAMRRFSERDLSDILMALAAFSARGSEMRSQMVRNESRRASAFRTRELEPFLDACEFQFKAWSRVQAVRTMEWDMAKGMA